MGSIGSLLPEVVGGRYNIYLWSQPSHVLAKAAQSLRAGLFPVRQGEDGAVVELVGADIAEVISNLSDALSQAEQSALKILLFQGDEPCRSEYGSVTTFDQLLRSLEGQWLVGLLDDRRYKSVIQPIVSAKDQTRVYAYEFLLRGLDRAGKTIDPVNLFTAAAMHNVLPTLDHVARHSAVETAARLGVVEKLFINFTPAAIFDPVICLRSTLDAIASHGFRPENVVFEIVESEVVADVRHLRKIVEFLRAGGFKLALDDFGSGFNNLGAYLDLEPDYIKIDKQLTGRMIHDSHRREMVGGFIASAQRSDAKIIAEGIEDGNSADMLTSMGVDFLQGYYFGRPADAQAPVILDEESCAKIKIKSV